MNEILTKEMIELLCDSQTNKALATNGTEGLNVVPVSSIRVKDNKIWLIDYFFGKTRTNILSESKASLVAWRGLEGFQIKASIVYITEGVEFEKAKEWIAYIHPTRTVKGLLLVEPDKIFSISIADKV